MLLFSASIGHTSLYVLEDRPRKTGRLFHIGCHEYSSGESAGDLILGYLYNLTSLMLSPQRQKQIHRKYARTTTAFHPEYLELSRDPLDSSRQKNKPHQVLLIYPYRTYQENKAVILHHSWL